MDPTHRNFIELLNGADQLKWTAYSSHDIKYFSKNEIEKITGNYKTTVGQGAFGKVYAGTLEDRSMVAVKILDHNNSKMRECLAKEVIVHSQINHRNVTRLIGYCIEEDALVMITEYIPNGNLEDILHKDVRPISLDTRLRIATECAGALAYMHSQMYTRVIHGDVKPANILLSQDLNAKISDFGISRLVNTDMSLYTTLVIGSIGYMDPLFVRTGRLTPKSDVYSFGVVLLEMFTRKKVKADNGGLSLVDGFIQGLSKGFRRVREMFDAEISDSSNNKILDGVAKLIGECLSMEVQKRPEMTNVAERLQALRRAHHQGQERVGLFSWGRKTKPETIVTGNVERPCVPHYGNAVSRTFPSPPCQNPSQVPYHIPVPRSSIPSFQELGDYKPDSAAEKTIPAKRTCQESRMDLELELKDLLGCPASVLGQGMFGNTYKLVLGNGTELVTKTLKRVRPDLGEEEFRRRVAVISDVQSDLVMPLHWYHCSKSARLLVYSYMPMGSLAALLHGKNGSAGGLLIWERRSSIALAVARAVAAIHSAGPASCHGNIKSSNVFLTGDYEARLSEHGLHTLVGTPFSGWSGYRAPEVTVIASDTTKLSDVYSFGVLLLELLTGKCPTNMLVLHGDHRVDLPRWVRLILREDWTTNLLDEDIIVHEQQENEMQQLMHLAMVCCQRTAIRRPTISEVVQKMEEIRRSSCFHRGSAPAETSITPGKETDKRPAIFDVHSASAPAETSIPVKETELEQSSDASPNETRNKLASEEERTGMILGSVSTIVADSSVMGRGTFGTTWKVVKGDMTGIMIQDNIAATESINKELVLKLMQGVDLPKAEFDQRIAAIKTIKSDLLVPLHGHYFSNGEKALVYSYMPTGSLSALLHGNGGSYGRLKLDWEQRTAIALSVAHGLAAIHSAAPRAWCHCHGNIKSSNILLTSDYGARLSENGLYTLVGMPSFVAASRVSGYLAPEVASSIRVTRAADVYSFGILLIELLTARDPADASLRAKGLDLSRWVHSVLREDWMEKVLDVELVRQQGAPAQRMGQLLHLAMDCCTSYDLRPTIFEVASRIEDVRASVERGTFLLEDNTLEVKRN